MPTVRTAVNERIDFVMELMAARHRYFTAPGTRLRDDSYEGEVKRRIDEMAVFRDTLSQIPHQILNEYLRVAERDRWRRRVSGGIAALGICGTVAAAGMAITQSSTALGAIALASCMVAAVGLRMAFTERDAYEKMVRHFAEMASQSS
jgi:hypothetical protein